MPENAEERPERPRTSLAAPTNARREALFEAIAKACRINIEELTASARGELNRAAKELDKAGAMPTEIGRRADVYRERFPTAELTPSALAKHWPTLGGDVKMGPAGRDLDDRPLHRSEDLAQEPAAPQVPAEQVQIERAPAQTAASAEGTEPPAAEATDGSAGVSEYQRLLAEYTAAALADADLVPPAERSVEQPPDGLSDEDERERARMNETFRQIKLERDSEEVRMAAEGEEMLADLAALGLNLETEKPVSRIGPWACGDAYIEGNPNDPRTRSRVEPEPEGEPDPRRAVGGLLERVRVRAREDNRNAEEA